MDGLQLHGEEATKTASPSASPSSAVDPIQYEITMTPAVTFAA